MTYIVRPLWREKRYKPRIKRTSDIDEAIKYAHRVLNNIIEIQGKPFLHYDLIEVCVKTIDNEVTKSVVYIYPYDYVEGQRFVKNGKRIVTRKEF